MTEEIPLGGGWSTRGVVRVGDTVRRPPEHASQLMRHVLVHLEEVGFDAAPRWRGLDEKGRDVLTFLEGETFSDTRQLRWSDGQLAAAGALLRRYHDAVAGTDLAGASEVVCHGDFGPWNLIWVDGDPRFVIDFDNAHPGPRLEDVGYAVWKFEIAAYPAAFLRGYGLPVDVRDAVDYAKQRERERFARNDWPADF
jgi:aminoglycoside phosphotransferase (APT) family kinase protein